MNLSGAHARARTITGDKAAASMYNNIEYELALGEVTPEQEQEGENALAELDRRFDGIRERARSIDQPPNLSRSGHKRIRGDHPPPPRPRSSKAPPKAGKSPKGGGANGRPAPRARARARAPISRAAERRFGQTGIPAAYESGTQLLMRTLGLLAGLSLFYLLVTPRGTRAVQLSSSGLTHALQALVSPSVDPLRAGRASSSTAGAAGRRGSFTNPFGPAGPGTNPYLKTPRPPGLPSTGASKPQAAGHLPGAGALAGRIGAYSGALGAIGAIKQAVPTGKVF